MNLPHPSRLLRSAERAGMPAVLAGLLLAAALVQLALPATPPLPIVDMPAARSHAPAGVEAATVSPVPARPAILANAIFAPRVGAGAGKAADTSFTLAGTALSRRAALAVVRSGSGAQVLRVGESVAGYRLVALGRGAAVFAGRDGRHVLRVGAGLGGAPTSPKPAAANAEENDE